MISSTSYEVKNCKKLLIKKPSANGCNLENKKLNSFERNLNLPYMGQILLENQKPRRGRKPKNNIHQLILKNYGISYDTNSQKDVEKNQLSIVKKDNFSRETEPLNLCTKDLKNNASKNNKKVWSIQSRNSQLHKIINHKKEINGNNNSIKSNEVNICKFKFVNGSLHEKTVFSFDRPKDFFKSGYKTYPCNDININNALINSGMIVNSKKKIHDQEAKFEGKSYLIKTQEFANSNESAYYKFRHLKKFTRYLIKNWKDYLPIEEKKN